MQNCPKQLKKPNVLSLKGLLGEDRMATSWAPLESDDSLLSNGARLVRLRSIFAEIRPDEVESSNLALAPLKNK